MCFHCSILWDFKKAAKLVESYHIPHSVRTPYTTIIHSSQLMTNIDTVLLNSRIYLDFISFPLTWSRILSMEKAMAPHSSTLAWQIPWTEEPGRLQSMGSLRVGHNWATSLSLFTFMHWRRKWQPTPVFLPGESQGWGDPGGLPSMGSHRVGHNWSDLAVAVAGSYQRHILSLEIVSPSGSSGWDSHTDFSCSWWLWCFGEYCSET